MNNCRVCKASIAGLGWAWDKASQQQATGQPASQPASLCVPVGWAGNVSESIRFRTKSNTILVDDHFGISAGWLAGWLVSPFPPSSSLIPPPSSFSSWVTDVMRDKIIDSG